MITRIEARNFKCLKHVDLRLKPFHVLVGPNGSGKTSLFEAIEFVARLATWGPEATVAKYSNNFYDLTWQRGGTEFELAIEAIVPEAHRAPSVGPPKDSIRYEIRVGIDPSTKALAILAEQIYLWRAADRGVAASAAERSLLDRSFATPTEFGYVLEHRKGIVRVQPECNTGDAVGEGDLSLLTLPRRPNQSLLYELQRNSTQFRSANWLSEFLEFDVIRVRLEDVVLDRPSPPGLGGVIRGDGSGFPWLVERLHEKDPEHYAWWMDHVRASLPGFQGLRVIEKPEDKHKYLMLQYANELEVPSWMASDGTLRFLALTFLAYSNSRPRPNVLMIEEPETAIHPLNIELVMQSLGSAWGRQILIATHSPEVVSVSKLEDLLVFSSDPVEGTRIIPGKEHSDLGDWHGQPSLRTLYASGVFG